MESSASVAKLSLIFKFPECVSHTDNYFRLNIKGVMPRENPFRRKERYFFKRVKVCARVR